MKRAKSLFLLAALVVASAVFAGGGFVVFTAIVDPPRHMHTYPDVFREDKFYFLPDPELGLAPKARYAGIVETTSTFFLYTDGRGARIDRPDAPDLARVDILTIGGSQSWGQGVANEDTFTSVLARRLGLTARNLSTPGYGGVQSMLILRRNIDLRPKIVLYAFWEDHLRRNLRRCTLVDSPVCLEPPRVEFDKAQGFPFIHYPEAPERDVRLVRRWYLEASGGEETTFWTDLYWVAYKLFAGFDGRLQEAELDTDSSRRRQVRAAEFVLSEMQTVAKAADASLIVIFIPSYAAEISRPPHYLSDICRRLGTPLVSMNERFKAMKNAGEPVGIPGDGHLTTAAHRAIAEAVAEQLVPNTQ